MEQRLTNDLTIVPMSTGTPEGEILDPLGLEGYLERRRALKIYKPLLERGCAALIRRHPIYVENKIAHWLGMPVKIIEKSSLEATFSNGSVQ